MFASVTTGRIHSDKWDEVSKLLEEEVKPLAQNQKGFINGYVLRLPGTDDSMTFVLWETEADALASAEPGGAFREAIGKIAHTLADQPERKIYEVILGI